MAELTIKEAQKIVDKWVKSNTPGYWKPNNMMLRLMEEVGELAREVNHRFGEKPTKPTDTNQEIGYELADILFTITCMANSLDIDLEEAFTHVMEKYEKRDKHRHQ